MFVRSTPSSILLLAAVVIVASGCGDDGPPRTVVAGSVTLSGTPVEDGQIRYIPIEGTPGPVAIAPIRQGNYRCDDKGGVPLGKHRVEIFAWDPAAPPGGRGDPPRPQWAPAKYNQHSELTETIEATDSVVTKNFQL